MLFRSRSIPNSQHREPTLRAFCPCLLRAKPQAAKANPAPALHGLRKVDECRLDKRSLRVLGVQLVHEPASLSPCGLVRRNLFRGRLPPRPDKPRQLWHSSFASREPRPRLLSSSSRRRPPWSRRSRARSWHRRLPKVETPHNNEVTHARAPCPERPRAPPVDY